MIGTYTIATEANFKGVSSFVGSMSLELANCDSQLCSMVLKSFGCLRTLQSR